MEQVTHVAVDRSKLRTDRRNPSNPARAIQHGPLRSSHSTHQRGDERREGVVVTEAQLCHLSRVKRVLINGAETAVHGETDMLPTLFGMHVGGETAAAHRNGVILVDDWNDAEGEQLLEGRLGV